MSSTGALGTSVQSGSQPNSDDHGRAALGYLVWPVAFFDMLRGSEATFWSRLHARQAALYGLVGSALFLLALALPLVIVIALPSVQTRATIVLYAIGLALDLVVGGVLFACAVVYAARASKGELFGIPVITNLCDRFLPITRM